MQNKDLVGKRIELVFMGDDPCPMAPGTKGKVISVCDFGDGTRNISVAWEANRSLSLVCPPDRFRVLED